MSRPKYLTCIMTPNVIRGIKERQRTYDRDPEAYDREERRRREEYEREQQELAEARQLGVLKDR